MEVNRGDIVVEGMDVIIQRGLDKHRSLLDNNIADIQAFEIARTNEINRKRYYGNQKGKRRYDDAAMDEAIRQMNKNINHLSYRITVTEELKKDNTRIVDTLTEQLKDYNKGIKKLIQAQKDELNANRT